METGLCPSSLELDALSVVNLINSNVLPGVDIGVVLHDIFLMLKNSFFSSISFVPRIANSVAHNLAKIALDYEGESRVLC